MAWIREEVLAGLKEETMSDKPPMSIAEQLRDLPINAPKSAREREAFNLEKLRVRLNAFNMAAGLVDPMVLNHGLAEYQTRNPILGSGTTITVVDQHIDHIIRVAEWLLGEQT